jgi:hypothetical protein
VVQKSKGAIWNAFGRYYPHAQYLSKLYTNACQWKVIEAIRINIALNMPICSFPFVCGQKICITIDVAKGKQPNSACQVYWFFISYTCKWYGILIFQCTCVRSSQATQWASFFFFALLRNKLVTIVNNMVMSWLK